MEILRWVEPEILSRQVFVGNLPPAATLEELIQALSEVGSVKSITVYRRGKSEKQHAFAFVEMSTMEEALRVIHEFDRGEMHGQELRISQVRAA